MRMRAWLLTCTTYGTWLPGDARGSVTSVRDNRPEDAESLARIEHDEFGTPWESPIPELEASARHSLKGEPIYLTLEQAEELLAQFQETAKYRGRELKAVAIMANHFHLVVLVAGDPDPTKILGDCKAYGSRRLNRKFGQPSSEEWWTDKGSKRKMRNETAVLNAMKYVLYDQPNPLIVWSPDTGRLV